MSDEKPNIPTKIAIIFERQSSLIHTVQEIKNELLSQNAKLNQHIVNDDTRHFAIEKRLALASGALAVIVFLAPFVKDAIMGNSANTEVMKNIEKQLKALKKDS